MLGLTTLSFWTLWACGASGPATTESCRAMSAGAARDECWATVAPELFRGDPVAAETLVREQVQDPTVLDFIWLTVTREVYPETPRYCEQIADEALKTRCRTVVSRPHLHRSLKEGGAPQGPRGPDQAGPPMPPG